MILCNNKEKEQRIFEWVQTYLQIEYEDDLKIFSVEPFIGGFQIIYEEWSGQEGWEKSELTLFNSQILLFESFRK